MAKCTFCKSEEIMKETPLMELGRDGEYHHKKTFCCKAQEANHKYAAKHFEPEDRPDMEDIEKWKK